MLYINIFMVIYMITKIKNHLIIVRINASHQEVNSQEIILDLIQIKREIRKDSSKR